MAAPVIEARVTIPGIEGEWTLLGVDPLSDFRLRSLRLQGGSGQTPAIMGGDSSWTLFGPAGLPADEAGRVTLVAADREQRFRAGGRLELPGGRDSRLLVTDISLAQAFLSLQGRISHIDLRLDPGAERLLERHLPPGAQLIDLALHDGAREDMSQAFRINLTALSLLALVVAMFLVYSTVSFQVVRRRRLFGLLGAIGATRWMVAGLLLVELLLVGLAGTALGILLGSLLAQTLATLVGGTIDALYHALSEPVARLSPITLARALLVGLAATLVSGLVPVLLATRAPVVNLLRGQGDPQGLRKNAARLLPVTIGLSLPAAALVLWPSQSLVLPFAGLFLLICASALLGPWLLHLAGKRGGVGRGGSRGLVCKMALGNASRHLDRTGVAVAALAVAVSATLGVEMMIRSFRYSVEDWLAHYLRADIYLSTGGVANGELSNAFLAELEALPGVGELSTGRRVNLDTASGPVTVFALDVPPSGFAGFRIIQSPEGDLWRRFHVQGEVLVSEPLARRRNLSPGDSIRLPTDRGLLAFTIAAVYRDYSSDRGLVTMDRRTWNRFYDDPRQVAAALYLSPGEDARQWIGRVRALPNAPPGLFIRSNRGLRKESLAVFDQTFRITGVLRWLAVIVAVTGIYSSLMALLLERRREFDMLSAIGFSRRQTGGLLLGEAGFCGLVAGLVAVPLGMLLSVVLIRVINLRSFGWSMESLVDWSLAWQAIGLSILAALAAAVWPAWRFRADDVLRGLRSD
jgi:putative ABC transport system permease protein